MFQWTYYMIYELLLTIWVDADFFFGSSFVKRSVGKLLKSDNIYEQVELAQWYKLLISLFSSNVESEALHFLPQNKYHECFR